MGPNIKEWKNSEWPVLGVYHQGYFKGWIELHELTGHQAVSSAFHASETEPSLGSELSRLLHKEGMTQILS